MCIQCISPRLTMAKPKLIEESAINMSELREELTKIQKRDGELSFRANKTMEYLNNVVTLPIKPARELYEKIEKLGIPRLKDSHIHKIVDILPGTVEELKTIIQGYTLTITQENLKKIVDTVSPYLEK